MTVLQRPEPPVASLDIRLHPLYYWGMNSVKHSANPPRKTKPKGRHPDKALSAAFVRTAPPGRHCDGNGLYLYVQPTGTRSWIQRLAIRGRNRELGLGSVALISLAEAREQALASRKLARSGGDPLAEKRRTQGVPSFAESAVRVMEQKRAGWRSPGHSREWISSLRRYAFPRIGEMAVSEVTSADVLEILTPIWHVKAPTARHVHQRIRTVLEWAVAMEFRTDNPCDRIGPILGAQNDVVTHMRALPHRDVASAIETVRGSGAPPVVKLAFEFVVLTAARWGEVRGAEWAQIDRREGGSVDDSRHADEGAARAPGAAVPPHHRDSQRGAEARGRQFAGVHPWGWQAALRKAAAPASPELQDRGRAARLPLELPGLGGRGDGSSARSHRSGAGACGPEQSRGGKRPQFWMFM